MPMAVVEILDVSRSKLDSERLWGFAIDDPVPGSQSEVWAIPLRGWVLGRMCAVVALELNLNNVLLRTTSIGLRRPDVAGAYPNASGAEVSGFGTGIGVLGTGPNFEFELEAVFADKSRMHLAVIRGQTQPLQTTFHPKLQPLMVTTLGRTGGTWLMHLLSRHPHIVTNRAYPYETFAASYWMHMLKVLSEPANHRQSSHPGTFFSNAWSIGHNPFYADPLTTQTQPSMRALYHWFGRTYVEQLAGFCQSSIEAYYQHISDIQGQTAALFFLEKYQPWHIPRMLWELYSAPREIFLVRDFRDMVCSVLAFNQKRGYAGFGREKFNSDEDWIRNLRVGMLLLLKSWKTRCASGRLLRYEDLILRPREALTSLLAYAELDCSPSVVDRIIQTASETELRQHRTTEDPADSMGRWRRELTKSQVAACEEAFGDVLLAFGYD